MAETSPSSTQRSRRPSLKSLKRLVSGSSLRQAPPVHAPPVPAIPAELASSSSSGADRHGSTTPSAKSQDRVYGTAQLARSTASLASWGGTAAHLSSSPEDMRLTIPSPTTRRVRQPSKDSSSSDAGSTLDPTTPKTPTSKSPLRFHLALPLPRAPKPPPSPKRKPSRSLLAEKYGSTGKTEVGEGATAVIRTAHRPEGSREMVFAVKEFRKRKAGEREKDYMKKMTAEFCISSTMRHENVVQMLDLIQDERGRWCAVMEYLSGGDLFSRIKSGPLFQAEADSYFRQLVEGVSYLHSMGVAHRDIKPENLILDGKGKIKIADFGVSDVFRTGFEDTFHRSRGICGSDPYLPPEVFCEEDYDARLVDVWSSAVVYYCSVAETLPWPIAKPSDATFAVYLEDRALGRPSPAPLGTLGRESRGIIKKMLDPVPATRALMDEVLRDPWVRGIRRTDAL